jgi:glyoxylase-like metal-dependent hydrolase (beta-lactamase superfamily II)
MIMPITLVPAGNPGAFTGPTGNNTWLVDGPGGTEPLLVDAGVGHDAHIEGVKAALAGRPLARVFVTHGHPDHASGVPPLRETWPGIDVADGSRSSVAAGDGTLEVIPTPGHSPDHACLWDPASRVLFAGDLLVSGGTIMIAASSGGDLRAYLASLARVKALAPARIYPGHGHIIDNGTALIDEYVAHRLAREAEVVAALGRAPATVPALVAAIYPHLTPALEGAARETLLAHLVKLDGDGRAWRDGEIWRLR